ncbi:DUF4292 domain-containing protein [Phaeodactylibacter luteus]|uniref:DUF4292 domain-containing protein n=2 Tax=Phaeodactylibacter luteus TaxID=1564516 RepID=A0A5C6RLM3_9BACT|nr:DUF4292 domain-containing protein [Phaeodactylibacter luteus]
MADATYTAPLSSLRRAGLPASKRKHGMKQILTFWLPLVLSGLLLAGSGCNSAKAARSTSKKEMSAATLLGQLAKNRVSPEWFESRLKINYAGEDMSVSASATLRMRKDSLVWLSVKKFGFEVARAQITQDSVFVIDRINSEYTAAPLDYLASSYGLPASLQQLQDFLLGNPVFFATKGLTAEPLGPTYRLSGGHEGLDTEYLIGADDFLLKKITLSDTRNKQEMSALLSEYGPVEGAGNFSYLRNLTLSSPYSGTAEVALQFSNPVLNVPTQTQFSIPPRYTPAK